MTSVSSDKEIRARQHRLAWQRFETALADIEKALDSFSNYKGYENPSSKQDGLYELFDTGEKFKGDELEDKIQLHIDSLFSLPTKHQLHEKIRALELPQQPKKAIPPETLLLDSSYYDDTFFTPKNRYAFKLSEEELQFYRENPHETCLLFEQEKKRKGLIERHHQLNARLREEKKKAAKTYEAINTLVDSIDAKAQSGELTSEAISDLLRFVFIRNDVTSGSISDIRAHINAEQNICLVEFKLWSFEKIEIVGTVGSSSKLRLLTAKQREEVLGIFLQSIAVFFLSISAKTLRKYQFHTIALNISQRWVNAATGAEETGVICSLQAPIEKAVDLRLDRVKPNPVFNHLKGISVPQVAKPNSLRPIMTLHKADKRLIATEDVIGSLDDCQNLASMPWEEFEHLVAQVFELEFADDGSEIRVTQSSRDRGVDAIIFDPNPYKGGKYILQAKRYTNTVGVAAVRDLFGTVINEGANRGILITTASFGPEAYEFAKDKPISLVDGANLLNILQKQNLDFRIDLEEARKAL